MSFKSGAGGIEKKGKTVGKNYGDSGPSMGIQKGGKGGKGGSGGKTNANMKSMGRGLAKIAAQRGR
jgi:hypothetical protein